MSKFINICKSVTFNKRNSIDKSLFTVYRACRSLDVHSLDITKYIKMTCFRSGALNVRQSYTKIHRDHNLKYVLSSECDRIKVSVDESYMILISENSMIIPIISDKYTHVKILVNMSKLKEFMDCYSQNLAIKNLYDLYANV